LWIKEEKEIEFKYLFTNICMIDKIGLLILANFIPTVEQLGAIPIGVALGIDPYSIFIISLIANCFLFFPVYFGLKIFYDKLLFKIKLFNKYLERIRKKGKPYIDRYGILGLTLFIALPAPLTGTYTATILSWFLGLNWKKSFLAIVVGSAIGGLIVLIGSVGISNFLRVIFSF